MCYTRVDDIVDNFWHGVDWQDVGVDSGVFIIYLVVLNQILKTM